MSKSVNNEINKNTNYVFDIFIILIILTTTFFARFFMKESMMLLASNVLMIASFIFARKKFHVSSLMMVMIFMYFVIVAINLFFSQNYPNYFWKSIFNYSLRGVLLIFFAKTILDNYDLSKHVYSVLKALCIFLNVYFVINIPIIFYESKNNFIMMDKFLSINSFRTDHLTGLIGLNGTHILTFFWIILILVNFLMISIYNKRFLIPVTVAEIIFMMIIAPMNDNTAFMFIIGLFCIEIIIMKIKYFFKLKGLALVALIIMTLLVLYNSNNDFKKFWDDRVTEKFSQYFSPNSSEKDEERIALYKYALEYGNGYGIGSGIGSVTYADTRLPKHFGMSELAIKVYEGGLIYYASLIIVYSVFYTELFFAGNSKRKNYAKVLALISLNILILSIYTQIFSDQSLVLLITLFIFILNLSQKVNKLKKESEVPEVKLNPRVVKQFSI